MYHIIEVMSSTLYILYTASIAFFVLLARERREGFGLVPNAMLAMPFFSGR